jgi:hypothetical protein
MLLAIAVVYGELLLRRATWHETLLHPFLYVIDFKRALSFGEAHAALASGSQITGQCLGWLTELLEKLRPKPQVQLFREPKLPLNATSACVATDDVVCVASHWTSWRSMRCVSSRGDLSPMTRDAVSTTRLPLVEKLFRIAATIVSADSGRIGDAGMGPEPIEQQGEISQAD